MYAHPYDRNNPYADDEPRTTHLFPNKNTLHISLRTSPIQSAARAVGNPHSTVCHNNRRFFASTCATPHARHPHIARVRPMPPPPAPCDRRIRVSFHLL